jgi:hypothetical protein
MAVCIKPCRGCPLREGCVQRDNFRARARATQGAVSVTFRCDLLAEALRPGRRVVIRTPTREAVYSYDGGEYDGVHHKEVKATIAASRLGTFACVVDHGEIDDEEIFESVRDQSLIRFRKRMLHSRIIRFLDEPDWPVCGHGRVMAGGGCDRPDGTECYCEQDAAMTAEMERMGAEARRQVGRSAL